ncbi:DUF2177 family protein [Thioalkalivibrio sp.]|uniref:DUF2177 family protein n=1 Tax=Thioalkalivibrio sp. TaxID=2093813 RepID=UPI0012D5B281|nr:DUF2177 family protein [Thioalkalivibrio sp.]TVP77945.1 MAG: DUF2177 family protein [Thioalkalivibrio sp.]
MDLVFHAKLYVLTLGVFLAVDLLWLGVVARGFYQTQLRPFLSPRVNWPAAFIFYLLYVVGILIFAVLPGLAANSLAVAAGWGALFGFFTYATYELTNLATLKDWPLKVVLVDTAWGAALCTTVASAGFLIGAWLGSPG